MHPGTRRHYITRTDVTAVGVLVNRTASELRVDAHRRRAERARRRSS